MNASPVQPSPVSGMGRSAASLADFAPQSILALAAEPQRAAAVLIEPVEEIYRLVGWQTVELPAQVSPDECTTALVQAVNRLEKQFSISLWDADQDRPRLHESGPVFVEGVGQAIAVADLLPPLRVWMAGLSGGGSLAAGEAALAGALCSPVATYLPAPHQSASALARELQALRPDVILIVGGYEQIGRHSQEQVLALSHHVIEAAVQLPDDHRPLFCFAGNSQSANAALARWQEWTNGAAAVVADNVLFAAGSNSDTALHNVLERYHWQRSLHMPAMRRIAGWVDHPFALSSTQWAFAQAVRIWMRRHQLPALHGLYAGAIVGCTSGLGRWPARKTQGCGSVACVPENDPKFWLIGRPSAWSAATGRRSGRARLSHRPPRDRSGPPQRPLTGGIRWALSLQWPASAKPRRKRRCRCWRQTFFWRALPISPSLDAADQVGDNGESNPTQADSGRKRLSTGGPMTTTLRLSDGSYMRQTDIEPIIQLLNGSRCVEVTGFSNVGKSSLMRLLANADVWLHQLGEEGSAFLPVYIDCNRMLEMTEQGFYELVLRCLQESCTVLAGNPELQSAYEGLVAPANVFQVPLSFSNGLTAALQNSQYKLILLFDEFDEPFQQIDSRVFLNLRAKKDRFGNRLVFVTATVRPLAALRPGEHSSEFGELFSHQPWRLAPLPRHG